MSIGVNKPGGAPLPITTGAPEATAAPASQRAPVTAKPAATTRDAFSDTPPAPKPMARENTSPTPTAPTDRRNVMSRASNDAALSRCEDGDRSNLLRLLRSNPKLQDVCAARFETAFARFGHA